MRRRLTIYMLWLLTSAMLGGCHGGLTIPDGWRSDSVDAAKIDSNASRMQVLLCFGPIFSNHSALRLECPGRPPVLWDPGGMYGVNDAAVRRERDVVYEPVPTVAEWWTYRRDAASESFHLIYEWDLDAHAAAQMYDVLTGRTGDFETGAAGGACCLALCDFLIQYARDQMTVPRKWLMPHDLGRHLWTQEPARVYVYQRNRLPGVWTRSATNAARR